MCWMLRLTYSSSQCSLISWIVVAARAAMRYSVGMCRSLARRALLTCGVEGHWHSHDADACPDTGTTTLRSNMIPRALEKQEGAVFGNRVLVL